VSQGHPTGERKEADHEERRARLNNLLIGSSGPVIATFRSGFHPADAAHSAPVPAGSHAVRAGTDPPNTFNWVATTEGRHAACLQRASDSGLQQRGVERTHQGAGVAHQLKRGPRRTLA
jgi:hypothetical protein